MAELPDIPERKNKSLVDSQHDTDYWVRKEMVYKDLLLQVVLRRNIELYKSKKGLK